MLPGYEPFSLEKALAGQEDKAGLGAIIGRWPGEETDEEIVAALEEMR